jgi:hypothetical protein
LIVVGTSSGRQKLHAARNRASLASGYASPGREQPGVTAPTAIAMNPLKTTLFRWHGSVYGSQFPDEDERCRWCTTATVNDYRWFGDDGSVESRHDCPLCGWYGFTKIKMSSSTPNRSHESALYGFGSPAREGSPWHRQLSADLQTTPPLQGWDDVLRRSQSSASRAGWRVAMVFGGSHGSRHLLMTHDDARPELAVLRLEAPSGAVTVGRIGMLLGVRIHEATGRAGFWCSDEGFLTVELLRSKAAGDPDFETDPASATRLMQCLGCWGESGADLAQLDAGAREAIVRTSLDSDDRPRRRDPKLEPAPMSARPAPPPWGLFSSYTKLAPAPIQGNAAASAEMMTEAQRLAEKRPSFAQGWNSATPGQIVR